MAENNKKIFVDDGRTIANMDFYKHTAFSTVSKRHNDNFKNTHEPTLDLTRKERWAIIRAIYMTLIPFVIIMFLIFALLMTIIFAFWG